MPDPSGRTDSPPAWRTVKVFISSTFRDMHAERDHLVKVVFPELRERLERFRINLVDIDLRWGITREQAENDKVLELCLQLVDECRPFFIGILGERYGWVPATCDLPLWRRFGIDHLAQGRSITELEIIRGILLNPEMQNRAYFYFRDPQASSLVPEGAERSVYVEPEATGREKLAKLKDAIRRSGYPVMDPYPVVWTPAGGGDDRSGGQFSALEAFGQTVLDQLWDGIVREYGIRPDARDVLEADPEAVEDDFHERYAEQKLQTYVARGGLQDRILDYLGSAEHRPLMITGPAGSGKSALLSWAAHEFRSRNEAGFVVSHFVGASPDSGRLFRMLRRMCLALKERIPSELSVPDEPVALTSAFKTLVTSLPPDGKTLLVLDGIDQMDETGDPFELSWLPEKLPPGVKILCGYSSDAGAGARLADRSAELGFPSLEIDRLDEAEALEILRTIPAVSAKTLEQEQIRLLLDNRASKNPLFLVTALEELRGFGSFEQLDKRIRDFPNPERETGGHIIPDLFAQVLARIEGEHDPDRVKEIFCLLAFARNGLSEKELQALEPGLPRGDLFVILRKIRQYLIRRGGLICLSQSGFRQSVENRYTAASGDEASWHARLAAYFAALPLDDRAAAELPWQLERAGDWESLYKLLSRRDFFEFAWRRDGYEVQAFWSKVETASPFRAVDGYGYILKDPEANRGVLHILARLLINLGRYKEAESLHDSLIRIFRKDGDFGAIVPSLIEKSNILRNQGRHEDALLELGQAERICRQKDDRDNLQRILGNQGMILFNQGKLDEALEKEDEAQEIAESLDDKYVLESLYSAKAAIYKLKGDTENALRFLKQSEDICRVTGERSHLASTLLDEAAVYRNAGDLERAEARYDECEKIWSDLGDRRGLAKGLLSRSSLMQAACRFQEALDLAARAEGLLKDVGDAEGVSGAILARGNVLETMGDNAKALLAVEEAEALLKARPFTLALPECQTTKIVLLSKFERDDEALALCEEVESICRKLDYRDCLQAVLGNKAMILRKRKRFDEALALYAEKAEICKALGNKKSLAICLGNRANVFTELGKYEEALDLHREKARIAYEIGNLKSAANSHGNQGVILLRMGKPDEALAEISKQEEIGKRIGDYDDILMSLENQAYILHDFKSDNPAAASKCEEALRIFDSLGITGPRKNRLLKLYTDIRYG